ncbi:MetQ/NlpA family ABC transporter substrate-binding protein [Curtobacterium sp. BRB10]|uniref:MetQ/NlpA family ABC transporter substrate-binding protein n=1 Tax=Curtobacterium sp. BRB10 TaxID=2962579 RepID=UPI00288111A6|nr:MetQ/NlpA family ABC transporter substrate-binding protein [Curtobacterium sp. BRB10]MDT0234806.1 MetQ/NlpA family ABC transporter substrate-binding protein [Curtobacterium sp. BRB10]
MTTAPQTARWRRVVALGALTALTVTLAACSSQPSERAAADGDGNGDTVSSTPLKVYATPVPQGEILDFVQELADETGSGLKLDITASQQGLDSNELLANGDIDATLTQHVPYFTSWEAEHEDVTNLVNPVTVLLNVFGLYSDKYEKASDIPDGSKILVPNEQTNLPRALFILQDQGLITLDHPESDGSAEAVSLDESDITDNPKNLQFVPTDTVLRAQSLPDVAASFINGDIALSNGIDPEKALALEKADDNPYANVLTTRTDIEEDPRVQLLADYLTGKDVAEYIDSEYGGFVLPSQKRLED